MRTAMANLSHEKRNGVHYTPSELADFLAVETVKGLAKVGKEIAVLDPACGGGALLLAFAKSIPSNLRNRLVLVGYEMDGAAIEDAKSLLANAGARRVEIHNEDFLSVAGKRRTLFHDEPAIAKFDAVIANPPYVRTQVLGAKRAQELARQFDLTGRVDLYHAFAKAMASALKPDGVLGLLTSNRFLSIKSGASLRHLLLSEFELDRVFDLGDTKLFAAAVLPAIVIGRKKPTENSGTFVFERIYEERASVATDVKRYDSPLAALEDDEAVGSIEVGATRYHIERGTLLANDDVWSLSTPKYSDWLETVKANAAATFDQVGHVRVGIKTTADEVYVRKDWDELPKEQQPESSLLRPLITHREITRWIAPTKCPKQVLYPHKTVDGKRRPIQLEDYPQAAAYLEANKERLCKRTYVIESGRKWYEIWVPHKPADWQKPKILYPDISESPRFCFDNSGAIVQGDCYWIVLQDGKKADWLYLMLGVANSTFMEKFYDIAFHNKLYSGRRRFMTQYVKQVPLPDIESPVAQQIVRLVKELIASQAASATLVEQIDDLVWQAFGLSK